MLRSASLCVWMSVRCPSLKPGAFLPSDALLARYLLSSCVRPSACPSQAGIISKRLDKSSWFVAWRLPFTYPTVCFKEFGYLQKLGYFPLEHCPKLRTSTMDAASRSRCQQNSSSSSSMVEFVDDTYTTIDESWMFTTSRSSVTLRLHSIFLGFVVELVSTVDKILTGRL